MSPQFFLIFLMLPSIIAIGGIGEAHTVNGEWVGNPVRLIPVYYVDEVYCNDEAEIHTKGCYDPNLDEITIKNGYADKWVARGCTVLIHEKGHAWGLNESELHIFNCSNPNGKDGRGQFNVHQHPSPMYEWKGYAVESDPRKFRVE